MNSSHFECSRYSFSLPDFVAVVNQNEEGNQCRVEMRVFTNQEPIGRLVVRHIFHTGELDARSMVGWYVNYVSNFGVDLRNSDVIPAFHPEHFRSGWLFYPRSSAEGFEMETPLMTYGTDDGLLQIGLLGPGESTSEEYYSLNQLAFQEIRDSLRPN